MTSNAHPIALVTGGSAGLGLALVRALHAQGWRVVTDGRSPERLAAADLPDGVVALAGDVTDPAHREGLVARVRELGRLDLLVHNASGLGPLPMGRLAHATVAGLEQAWLTNVAAPLALTSSLISVLAASDGVLMGISSDAAVEHYETWGLYGATKAALDHVVATFGAEEGVLAYAVDPGDMRTQLHADAAPGEDLSGCADPVDVAPLILGLLARRPASGRYRAAEEAQVQR